MFTCKAMLKLGLRLYVGTFLRCYVLPFTAISNEVWCIKSGFYMMSIKQYYSGIGLASMPAILSSKRNNVVGLSCSFDKKNMAVCGRFFFLSFINAID